MLMPDVVSNRSDDIESIYVRDVALLSLVPRSQQDHHINFLKAMLVSPGSNSWRSLIFAFLNCYTLKLHFTKRP